MRLRTSLIFSVLSICVIFISLGNSNASASRPDNQTEIGPQGPEATFNDDFSSYTIGSPPTGYLIRGATGLTPTIVETGGSGAAYRAVNFPEVSWQYWDKWLLKDSLVLSGSYTVKVKLRTSNAISDRMGLTIAWNDTTWDRIDIQPNVYTNEVEFRVTYSGANPSNIVIQRPNSIIVDANVNYWLKVQAVDNGPGLGVVDVYWSPDNTNFTHAVHVTGLPSLTGLAGMSTAGPHLPQVYFDDFSVTYSASCGDIGDNSVALFTDPNYLGTCVVKGIGDFPNPAAMGIANDAVSSIKVGQNLKAMLCQDDNYGGNCEVYSSDASDLTGSWVGDNSTSSLRVAARSATAPTVSWTLPVTDGEVHTVSSGTVLLQAAATAGTHPISLVDFVRWDAINNNWVEIGWDTTAPYQANLDVAGLNDGWNQVNATAYDEWGSGSNSPFIWVYRNPPLSAPTILTATPVSRTQIDLTWQDNSSNETEFIIELYLDESLTNFAFSAPAAADSTSLSLSPLTCGKVYYFAMRAFNVNLNQYSNYSNTISATTFHCSGPQLTSPANAATLPGNTDVTLNWSPTTEGVAYKVELWGDSYSLMTPCDWQASQSCHVGQLLPGQMYWHVKARADNLIESDWSDTWSFTILGEQNPLPTLTSLAPSSVAAGGPDFTLTLSGTNFISSSTVLWNSSAVTTTYVSATRLTALIPSSRFASAGTTSITVQNPAPGGGISNSKSVSIQGASKPWTFIILMAADNNLYPVLARALQSLENQTPNPNVNVVVLFDGDRTNDSWRLIPQPNNNYTLGVNRWYLGEVNTGDPQTLTDLVSWAIANYPSRNIYLAIADHGRGTTGVAWDDTSNRDSLSPSELRSALNSATNSGQIKIDIVHFDTCLMAMLEDAYQLKDLASYMVASENLGWSVFAYNQYINPITGRALEVDLGSPYGPLVGQVTDETTPLQLATYIADSYHNHPALEDMPRTISVTDLSQAATVRAKLDALAALLRLNINTYKDNIKNTRTNLQKFDSRDYYRITQDDEYVDLYHMAEKLKSFIPDATLQAAAQELMGAISSYVVVEHHKSGIWSGNEDIYWNLDNAHGVSIYFPPKSGTTDYNRYIDHTTFRMTIDSQWDDFLQDYFSVMGLPPDDIADPGLPPMLTTTFYIHLPVIQRP